MQTSNPPPLPPAEPAPPPSWAHRAEEVALQLDVELAEGLSAEEVVERQQRHGLNQLARRRPRRAWSILLEQFRSVVVALLAAAAIISFLLGDRVEALAVLVVLLINAGIGFLTELRATRSMEALRRLGRVETTVRRDGFPRRVPSEELVPGDVVLLEGGDVVTADLRICEASRLQADESALTGESVPVSKRAEPLPPDTHLSDRRNMLHKGTQITRGSGAGLVVSTGLQTEIGRISELVEQAKPEQTPLEQRLDELGRRLVWVVLAMTALIAVLGIAAGREVELAIGVAVALAVAAIPEGLPIVATVALARGMWRMARRNAVIARLSAVETLGAINVILTDKTGTLTENRMTVELVELDGRSLRMSGTGLQVEGELCREDAPADPESGQLADELLQVGTLCNNASVRRAADGTVEATGDPTELALLVAAAKRGWWRHELLEEHPEQREEAFDPQRKLMATYHLRAAGSDRSLPSSDSPAKSSDPMGALQVAVKGAPEAVLEVCTSVRSPTGDRPLTPARRRAWTERSEQLAARGLRTLALATRSARRTDEPPYADLILLGVVGMVDPPRKGVREAVLACTAAGVEVSMVTGDHLATASHIARAVGLQAERGALDGRQLGTWSALGDQELDRLVQAAVIARASPEQKLQLIELHQRRGNLVAMTGDGVNDAPALRKADIGIAMGIRGTDVAKQASAMVLADDRFETIVTAIAEGRAIFANIRKFVVYLLSCNISEILVVGLAALVGAPLPLLPLQILFLNLVTDVFPALALGVGAGHPGLMSHPPRQAGEALVTPGLWLQISAYGALLCASVLGAMGLGMALLDLSAEASVTVSFLTLAFGQLWHVFNMRARGAGWLRNEITANRWVWAALLICVLLLGIAIYLAPVASVLGLVRPTAEMWALILGMSVLPVIVGGLVHRLER